MTKVGRTLSPNEISHVSCGTGWEWQDEQEDGNDEAYRTLTAAQQRAAIQGFFASQRRGFWETSWDNLTGMSIGGVSIGDIGNWLSEPAQRRSPASNYEQQ